jgi:hypothetical protein
MAGPSTRIEAAGEVIDGGFGNRRGGCAIPGHVPGEGVLAEDQVWLAGRHVVMIR